MSHDSNSPDILFPLGTDGKSGVQKEYEIPLMR